MVPDSSWLCWQEPTTCPYTWPEEFSANPCTLLLWDPFWHYPPSLLHHVVPPKFCTHFSSPLHIPHPLPNQNAIHYKNTKIKSQTKTITHTCASSILLQMNCRIGITSLKHDTPEPPSQLAPVRFKFLSSSWDSSSAQTQEQITC